MSKALEEVQAEFAAVVKTIDEKFGDGYSSKNPGLVQHLLSAVGSKQDRVMTKSIHAPNPGS